MIGTRVPMVDARERVTGTIDYVQNVSIPGMLHARILHSPYAHAAIAKIDVSAARRLPGVAAVLTRDDLLDPSIDPWFGPFLRDQAPLAIDRARFVGEPVAAVAAVSEAVARAAVDLIEVDYDPLPAVFDVDAAMASGAPILHEGPRRLGSGRQDIVARQPGLAGSNIIHLFRQRRGDPVAGFAQADVIVENTYDSPAVGHVPLETHVVVATFSGGRPTLWASSQAPSTLAASIAGILRLPISDVRVIVSTLGGGFGSKIDPSVEPIAVLLARKAGRPVRLLLDRSEEFVTATKHAARVRVRTGVLRDGTLIAHEATCLYNGGAYAKDTPEKIYRGYASMGPYRVPNIHVDSYGVYTNVVPACAFRGFGIPQVAWAHESQMDQIADALGMDPLELRSRNILHEGDAFSTGEKMPEDLHYDELFRDAADRIGWSWPATVKRDGPRVRGKSITSIIKGMSSFPATSMVRLNLDGSVNVLTSSVEMGQGALTALAQIAAHEATIPLERVRVSTPDTDVTPFDAMTAASRTTNFMGRAIREAVRMVKEQLIDLAAAQLEIHPDDLEVVDGRVSAKGSPERSLTFGSIVATSRLGSLVGSGRYVSPTHLDLETGQGIGAPQWHPAVCGCEVEVDEETGRITILQLHLGLYVGRMINPTQCELQVQGAALFGLGQALFEELVYDEQGTLTNPNLSDYMIPSFLDVPAQFGQTILETPGSIHVHGLGETALPAVAPAVANAVSRAVGVRVLDLPLTPEKVLRLIRARDAAGTGSGAVPVSATVPGRKDREPE
jgi:CO/xanthine dehydrogenase Mo-binding subunit